MSVVSEYSQWSVSAVSGQWVQSVRAVSGQSVVNECSQWSVNEHSLLVSECSQCSQWPVSAVIEQQANAVSSQSVVTSQWAASGQSAVSEWALCAWKDDYLRLRKSACLWSGNWAVRKDRNIRTHVSHTNLKHTHTHTHTTTTTTQTQLHIHNLSLSPYHNLCNPGAICEST